MKKIASTLLFITLIIFASYGQKRKTNSDQRELTPARGHYKQLASFSPKPNSSNTEIDKQKFRISVDKSSDQPGSSAKV